VSRSITATRPYRTSLKTLPTGDCELPQWRSLYATASVQRSRLVSGTWTPACSRVRERAGRVRELSFLDVLVKAAGACLSHPTGSGRLAGSHARSSPSASMATAQHACSLLHECGCGLLTAVSARIPAQLRSARTGPIGHTTNCRWREVPCGKLRSNRRRADVRTSKRRECEGRGRRRSTCRCGSSRRDARRARDGAPRCGLSPGGARGSR
jgi:hypothetical protein